MIGALQPVLRVSRIDPLDAIKDTGEAPSVCPAGLPGACPPLAENVLVRVRELEKHYPGADGHVAAIEGLSLEIRRGEARACGSRPASGVRSRGPTGMSGAQGRAPKWREAKARYCSQS